MSTSHDDAVWGMILLLASLCCLGTWPALLRLCSDQNNHSQRPLSLACLRTVQRNICHVYLDYATAYVLFSCIPFILGKFLAKNDNSDSGGSGSDSLQPLSVSLILVAMLGGTLLASGNLSLQWSTAVFGITLTTTLAIQASLCVVLGTFINYLLEPSKTPHVHLLGAGVLSFLMAIAMATTAQMKYAEQESATRHTNNGNSYTEIEMELPYGSHTQHPHEESEGESETVRQDEVNDNPLTNENDDQRNAVNLELERVKERKRTIQGLLVAISGGLCFGFFSPCFNIAINDPFHWNASFASDSSNEGDSNFSLAVARVNMWFSVAFWLASLIGNVYLLQRDHPSWTLVNVVVNYCATDGFSQRRLAVLAGAVCALGNILQFQGGKLVG